MAAKKKAKQAYIGPQSKDFRYLSISIVNFEDSDELKSVLDDLRKEEFNSQAILIGPSNNEGRQKIDIIACKGEFDIVKVDAIPLFDDGIDEMKGFPLRVFKIQK